LSRMRVGINESIRVFDSPVQRPVSNGAALVQDLLQTLGGVGSVANQLGNRYARQENEIRQEQAAALNAYKDEERIRLGGMAFLEQQDADIANELRGVAARDADARFTSYRESIANRTMLVPDGMSVSDYVEEIVDRDTIGLSPIYKERYGNDLRSRLGTALLEQQSQIQTQVAQEAFQNYQDTVSRAASPDEIVATLKEAATNYPRTTETERLASIVVPAARTAAMAGRTAEMNAALSVLGNRFTEEQRLILASHDAAMQREESDRNKAFETHILRMVEGGKPSEVIEDELNRGKAFNLGTEQFRLNVRNDIDRVKRAKEAEAFKLEVETAKSQFESEIDSMLRQTALGSGPDHGLFLLPDKVSAVLPDGKKHTINVEEARQRVTDEMVGEIGTMYQDNQAAALAKQVDFVARNGVVPSRWKALLNNAEAMASIDTIVPPPSDKPGQKEKARIPAALQEAYALYKSIRTINDGVAERAMTNKDASTLFDLAAVAETLPEYGGNPEAAMLAAARVAKDMRTSVAEYRGFNLEINDNDVEGIEAKNVHYVSQEILKVAKVYKAINGVSDKRAVEQAVKAFNRNHTNINGYMVRTRGELPAEFIDRAAKIAARNYVMADKSMSEDRMEGVSESDLTLVNDGPGGWRLINGDTEMELERIDEPGMALFTTADLIEMVNKQDAIAQAEEAKARGEEVRRVIGNRRVRKDYTIKRNETSPGRYVVEPVDPVILDR
jgi:hypothetical protein